MLRCSIFVALTLAAAAPLSAQSADQLVHKIARLARENLGHAKPIVPAALDQQTVRRGALSGQIEACGGRWDTASYLPYMARLRASQRYSEEQLTYVGVVHGIAQQMTVDSLAERAEPCPAEIRAAIARAAGR